MPGNICDVRAWELYTPVVGLSGGAGNVVPVYTTNKGRYFKVKDIVYADIVLFGDGGAEGAGTGQITISLPVISGSNINGKNIGIIGLIINDGFDYLASGLITTKSNVLCLSYNSALNVMSIAQGALQKNTNREIRLHFWYEID